MDKTKLEAGFKCKERETGVVASQTYRLLGLWRAYDLLATGNRECEKLYGFLLSFEILGIKVHFRRVSRKSLEPTRWVLACIYSELTDQGRASLRFDHRGAVRLAIIVAAIV